MKCRRPTLSSVAVRTDDLAAAATGQGLVDTDPRARARHERALRVLGPAAGDQRPVGPGVERPRVDRILEEPDRAIEERKVAATGMETRGRQDHVVALVIV